MNVVDSSAWLAYFADEPAAKHFQDIIQKVDELIVPVVTVYEVFKVVLRETSENEALQVAAVMQKGKVVDLTSRLAISAGTLSLQYALPMADSLILATAREYDATIWTQDAHFKDVPGVNYFPKIQ